MIKAIVTIKIFRAVALIGLAYAASCIYDRIRVEVIVRKMRNIAEAIRDYNLYKLHKEGDKFTYRPFEINVGAIRNIFAWRYTDVVSNEDFELLKPYLRGVHEKKSN